jgi:protoheme IX farnesyltransferase
MYATSFAPRNPALRRYRYLLLAATLFTFLLMVVGTLVHTSQTGLACPDWPTCYGSFALPAGDAARLQITHRALAGLAALLMWVAAGWAAVRRIKRAVALPVYAAGLSMLAEVLLGGQIVLTGGAQPGLLLQPLHLGLAALSLGLLCAATLSSFLPSGRLSRNPFTRLAWVTLLAVFVLMVSGSLVSGLNAGAACTTWPLCRADSPLALLALIHRALTLVVAVLETTLFLRAWKSQRSQSAILTATTAAFVLLWGQVLLGALKVTRGFPLELVALHAAAAAALWAVQALAATAAALSPRSAEEEATEAAQPLPLGARLKDFFVLNKPVIVLLLLVTTYAGMVVGARRLPGLELTIWTLLGGALAAGGSSALNQYIDRETDKAMQRTAKRPLPAGRMFPAEGLAYGTGAVLASFFLLAGFVNLLAALLSLAGMFYYVLLYSVWLKHATVQNIVIGGGAGAIPPLVGWAAATGALNIPSLFLFAIIFFWTPPHFWALALIRKNDYARGKVPMLPVIKGEVETRKQVFIYTLELVGLTLLMPLLKLAGSVYLVSAAVLGAWMIFSAWRVLKLGGNKTAWTMYRTSSMYLMFLFIALVVDVLI